MPLMPTNLEAQVVLEQIDDGLWLMWLNGQPDSLLFYGREDVARTN